MVKFEISFQRNANSQLETIISTYPNENISPTIFSPGHEQELSTESPFIAERIWGDINNYVHQQHIITSSVTCVMEFCNGTRINLPTEIINAKHNTSTLNS